METVSNINKLTAAIIRILILTSHGVSIEATTTKPNELATPVSNRTLNLILVLLLAANAAAQEPAIRTQTTAVLVPTLVKGANGKLVHGLRAEDFSIEDDGVPQMIQLDEVLDVQPVSIVIAIQSKSGGNLSEALGNLSRVLRERKKMRGKITAMSMEAKASAAIIGAVPFLVVGALYVSSPAYVSLLWITFHGRMISMIAICWMGIGIAMMKKMIAFDF